MLQQGHRAGPATASQPRELLGGQYAVCGAATAGLAGGAATASPAGGAATAVDRDGTRRVRLASSATAAHTLHKSSAG